MLQVCRVKYGGIPALGEQTYGSAVIQRESAEMIPAFLFHGDQDRKRAPPMDLKVTTGNSLGSVNDSSEER